MVVVHQSLPFNKEKGGLRARAGGRWKTLRKPGRTEGSKGDGLGLDGVPVTTGNAVDRNDDAAAGRGCSQWGG